MLDTTDAACFFHLPNRPSPTPRPLSKGRKLTFRQLPPTGYRFKEVPSKYISQQQCPWHEGAADVTMKGLRIGQTSVSSQLQRFCTKVYVLPIPIETLSPAGGPRFNPWLIGGIEKETCCNTFPTYALSRTGHKCPQCFRLSLCHWRSSFPWMASPLSLENPLSPDSMPLNVCYQK